MKKIYLLILVFSVVNCTTIKKEDKKFIENYYNSKIEIKCDVEVDMKTKTNKFNEVLKYYYDEEGRAQGEWEYTRNNGDKVKTCFIDDKVKYYLEEDNKRNEILFQDQEVPSKYGFFEYTINLNDGSKDDIFIWSYEKEHAIAYFEKNKLIEISIGNILYDPPYKSLTEIEKGNIDYWVRPKK